MSETPGQTANDHNAQALAEALFGDSSSLIKRYVDILTSRGIDWGLLGPREVERVWERHILNSVALADLIPAGASVADVGSGAGLPGIPLAILRPDLQVSLIEPLLRRVNFLTEAVDELGLDDRVAVIRERAEEHQASYDVVTARALAPLPRLVTWCAPLLTRDGTLLALKGAAAEQEVTDATGVLDTQGLRAEVLSVRAHATAESTSVVRIRR